jgi:hypothetical protein
MVYYLVTLNFRANGRAGGVRSRTAVTFGTEGTSDAADARCQAGGRQLLIEAWTWTAAVRESAFQAAAEEWGGT